MVSLRRRTARVQPARGAIELGRQRAQAGDTAGAAEAFEQAIASGDAQYAVIGALHLWVLRSEANDLRAADEAYLRAIDLGVQRGTDQDEPTADKSLTLGNNIATRWRQFVQPARQAFRRSLASGDPKSVSLAGMGSAGLELQEFEEVAGSPNPGADIAALKRVIDAGLPDYVPVAAKWLAFISEQTSDVDLARTAMGAVIDSANLKYASRTAMKVGKLFTRTGHATEAIAAYRFVVDNDQEASVVAARHLGDLLAAEGDRDGARTAYEFVLARSQYPHTISDVRAALDRL